MTRRWGCVIAVALAVISTSCNTGPQDGTLIANVSLVDGTGSPARPAAVRIIGDRIAEVGELTPRDGDRVIDGGGLVLAPGFIDTHSHHAGSLAEQPDATAVVSQGVTTIVSGQDGSSERPLQKFLDSFERPSTAAPSVNVASCGITRCRSTPGDDATKATATSASSLSAWMSGTW